MSGLLTPLPSKKLDDFREYCLDWFDQRLSPDMFARFKRIVRSAYKTWDSWDLLDYKAVKCLSDPWVDSLTKVALEDNLVLSTELIM